MAHFRPAKTSRPLLVTKLILDAMIRRRVLTYHCRAQRRLFNAKHGQGHGLRWDEHLNVLICVEAFLVLVS